MSEDTQTAPVRRFTDRRHDPLRRRTPQAWLDAFTRLKVSAAVIVAAKRVTWDYPASAEGLAPITSRYLDLTKLPARSRVASVLVKVGYPDWQVVRSLRSYGAAYRTDPMEINQHEHELRARVGASFRDENEEDRRFGRSSIPIIRLRF